MGSITSPHVHLPLPATPPLSGSAAQAGCLGNAGDGETVGSMPQGEIVLRRERHDIGKGLLHPPAQMCRDLIRIPEKPLSILYPL